MFACLYALFFFVWFSELYFALVNLLTWHYNCFVKLSRNNLDSPWPETLRQTYTIFPQLLPYKARAHYGMMQEWLATPSRTAHMSVSADHGLTLLLQAALFRAGTTHDQQDAFLINLAARPSYSRT